MIRALLCLILAQVVASVHAQQPQFRMEITAQGIGMPEFDTEFGAFGGIHRIGDINLDGFDDIMVNSRNCFFPYQSVIFIFSGFDGSALSVINHNVGCFTSPSMTKPFGDFDGDGIQDLLISRNAGGLNWVEVISGSTSAVLRTYNSPNVPPNLILFGTNLQPMGDVDNDGTPDFAASRVFDINWVQGSNTSYGCVDVISGATGALIRTHFPPIATGVLRFGGYLRSELDADGDGVKDLLVGSIRNHIFGYSGANGALLFQFAFPYLGGSSGNTPSNLSLADFTGMGDINGDGLGEIACSWTFPSNACAAPNPPNRVWIVTALTQQILHEITSSTGLMGYGRYLDGSVDADADGVNDLLIAGPGLVQPPANPTCDSSGFVDVVSGRTGTRVFRIFAPSSATPYTGFPDTVRWVGDVDLDGFIDIAATSGVGLTTGSSTVGRVVIYALPPIAPLSPAEGAVNFSGPGGRVDVLRVGHSFATNAYAGGPGRCVVVPPLASNVFLSMAAPPQSASPANYILFAALGSAFGLQPTILPNGLGATSVPPAFLTTFAPIPVFPIGDTFGFAGALLPLANTPGQGAYILSVLNPSLPATLTIQGLIEDPSNTTTGISVTNAVRVVIR